MLFDQVINAQLADPRVQFQCLDEVVPALFVLGLNLLLDILDGFRSNLLELSPQFSCESELFEALGSDGVLNIVLILNEN